ncbi:hypothetical protein K4X33_17935 [Brevibacterium casei]|nr:hypothetical protein K4X33_17935 [Brevibacterium casei]
MAAAASGGQSGENASGAADGGDADGGRSGTGVSMRLDEITPWLDDKGTLTVRGTVTNSTDTAIVDPQLRLGMSLRTLDSEYRIEAWKTDQSRHRVVADLNSDGPEARKQAEKQGGDDADPVTSVDATFAKELAPGSTGEFTITVPADQLGLRASSPNSSWGSRGLSVQIRDASGALATGVGFTTWYPNPKFDRTAISFLAPVTLPGYTTDGLIGPDELDAAIAEDGALTNAARAFEDPKVAIALDPRVVASFEAAVAEPPPRTARKRRPVRPPRRRALVRPQPPKAPTSGRSSASASTRGTASSSRPQRPARCSPCPSAIPIRTRSPARSSTTSVPSRRRRRASSRMSFRMPARTSRGRSPAPRTVRTSAPCRRRGIRRSSSMTSSSLPPQASARTRIR